MRLQLLAAAFGFCSLAYAQEKELTTIPPPVKTDPSYVISSSGDTIQLAVDEQATFPEGTAALLGYINTHLHYPANMGDTDIYGKVYVKLVIQASGQISDPTIVRGMIDCPLCSEEAIKLVNSMPKWVPGKLNGKPVSSYFYLPVAFKPSH